MCLPIFICKRPACDSNGAKGPWGPGGLIHDAIVTVRHSPLAKSSNTGHAYMLVIVGIMVWYHRKVVWLHVIENVELGRAMCLHKFLVISACDNRVILGSKVATRLYKP